LRTQVDNCKRIITELTAAAGQARAGDAAPQSVEDFLHGVVERWSLIRPQVQARVLLAGSGPAPEIVGEETVRQTLVSILNNAADASPQDVEVEGRWDDRDLTIEVRDRGPGISEETAARAGRSLFSTKSEGQGIGLFLANVTIERLGDDDPVFGGVLARALTKRGFDVEIAAGVGEAQRKLATSVPDYAVVDLKMPDGSGLLLVKELKRRNPAARIVVLTGFASVATAVEAIKLGAVHYLPKPADADEVVAAFGRSRGDIETEVSARPLSVERLEWEHIQKVLAENAGNVSATARALNMHRRTLQRKLTKRPARA
jgi:two-component system response regulator RegA